MWVNFNGFCFDLDNVVGFEVMEDGIGLWFFDFDEKNCVFAECSPEQKSVYVDYLVEYLEIKVFE